MVYHEGILVSSNEVVNAAAIGADIETQKIRCRVYRPSDTARNLEPREKFTFSLTDDPSLFFKGALTGRDEPDNAELSEEELSRQDAFFYPDRATKVYFCRVESTSEKKITDRYGETRLKRVEGKVLFEEQKNKGQHLDRKNPLLDAMVHASRLPVADERQRKDLQKKVRSVLNSFEPDSKTDQAKIKNKIIGFIEEWS
ncbi:MAG: DUF447 domain-containing protein [Candidatus Thermoplasmatota archaeon]